MLKSDFDALTEDQIAQHIETCLSWWIQRRTQAWAQEPIVALKAEQESLESRLRALVTFCLMRDQELPDYDDVAEAMEMSGPTLRRHCAAAGFSYQSIADEQRLALSKTLLEASIPSHRISKMLGFSCASGFSRFFSQHIGMSATEWRQQFKQCHVAQEEEIMSDDKRGFASMDRAKQREIASMGGKRAHELRTAHRFTPEEARAAGKKSHTSGNAHQFTPEEAAAAGRKGGRAAREKRAIAENASNE